MARLPGLLLLAVLGALVVSGLRPTDRTTWWLEVAPLLVAVPVLVLTARRFPLTTLAYSLIAIHAVVLIVGGHYTYAEVPLGRWAADLFHLHRNHYDRLGHFVQGFVPAIVAREVILRTTPLHRGGWLAFLVVCVCLAISAAYELLEWATALVSAEASAAFLGTQGDPWDTQWDMFLALVGAIVSLAALSRLHDRQMERLTGRRSEPAGLP